MDVDGYGYTPYNRFGEHYWFVDLEMDCSATENDWFEFKVKSYLVTSMHALGYIPESASSY